jgi:DNA repair protein RadA/Sms
MAKDSTQFVCIECGHTTIKWYGCCPGCGAWDALKEEKKLNARYGDKKPVPVSHIINSQKGQISACTLAHVEHDGELQRLCTGIDEWDRVVGGGIMPGAFIVLTGDPGVGKSTLLMHVGARFADTHPVLYVCCEESLSQIKGRAARLGLDQSNTLFAESTQFEDIVQLVQQYKPHVLMIDSLQSCYSNAAQSIPGTIMQLKELAFGCMRLAKEYNMAILATGHITKDGAIAGPKTLEHMVDAVLYLQSDERLYMRMLRSVKNRFGSTGEVGFFSMDNTGLRPVENVNSFFISSFKPSVGSVLASYDEGSRSLFVELQALVTQSRYPSPQRVIAGLDYNRVLLIIAILEKHAHIKLGAHDIFFKVSSGVKLTGNSIDVAIALSLLSSFFNKRLEQRFLALGEINLSGEIKPVHACEMHIQEAQKFGITEFVLSVDQTIDPAKDTAKNMCLNRVAHVRDLIKFFA